MLHKQSSATIAVTTACNACNCHYPSLSLKQKEGCQYRTYNASPCIGSDIPPASDGHRAAFKLIFIQKRWSYGVQDTIGASGQASLQTKKQHKGCKPVVITCPFGSCNPFTDISRFTKFAVPEGYVQPSTLPFAVAARNPPETSNRMAFQKRSPQEVANSLLAAQIQVAESKKMKVCSVYNIYVL
jgi:hypothetical protein